MSILLQGRNGNEFELGFVEDTYADVQDGTGDGTWATVTYRVATSDESWEETSPCLNAFEFSTLADWLDAAGSRTDAGKESEPSEVELLQPELKFTISGQTNEGVTVRIAFNLDERPEELEVDAGTEEMEYVDIFLTTTQLKAAAASLRKTIQDLHNANLKDDITGDGDAGIMGSPDEDLNMIDDIRPQPPGAGDGEDNAGER